MKNEKMFKAVSVTLGFSMITWVVAPVLGIAECIFDSKNTISGTIGGIGAIAFLLSFLLLVVNEYK